MSRVSLSRINAVNDVDDPLVICSLFYPFKTGLYSDKSFDMLMAQFVLMQVSMAMTQFPAKISIDGDEREVVSSFRRLFWKPDDKRDFTDNHYVDDVFELFARRDGEICFIMSAGIPSSISPYEKANRARLLIGRHIRRFIFGLKAFAEDCGHKLRNDSVVKVSTTRMPNIVYIPRRSGADSKVVDENYLYFITKSYSFKVSDAMDYASYFISGGKRGLGCVGTPNNMMQVMKVAALGSEFSAIMSSLIKLVKTVELPFFYDFAYAMNYLSTVDDSLRNRIEAFLEHANMFIETAEELTSQFLYVLNSKI